MESTIFAFTPMVFAAIPVALGVVQVIKATGLPNRFAPLMSLIVGIGLVSLTGVALPTIIGSGIIVGLAASGLWSGSKATFGSEVDNGA